MPHYSTWSVLKAIGNYLRLRPESDMIDLHLESSLWQQCGEGPTRRGERLRQ